MKKYFALCTFLYALSLAGCGSENHSASNLTELEPHDHWSASARLWSEQISSEPYRWPDGNTASVWGAIQAMRSSGMPARFKQITKIRSSHFAAGDVEAILIRQYEENSGLQLTIRAPLMVVAPGLASNPDDAMPRRAAYFFASRGYHVVVLSSPWSTRYIGQHPEARPGHIVAEAEVMRTLVAKVKNWLGSNYITHTDLVGESYGGFLAAVAFAQDAQQAAPIFDGTLTAVAPPVDIKHALGNVDQLIQQTTDQYHRRCSGSFTQLLIARSFGQASTQNELSHTAKECSRSMMAHVSFHNAVKDAAEAVDKVGDLGLLPVQRSERRNYLSRLRFGSFLSIFSPDAASFLQDDHLPKIFYWLNLARQFGAKKFRIILAEDDFLNLDVNITKLAFEYGFDSKNMLSLRWGGHLGFQALPEYDDFLAAGFSERREDLPPFHTYQSFLLTEGDDSAHVGAIKI